MKNIYLVVIVLYLLGISVYGWYLNKKHIKTSDDFVTGGRSLPLPILIGTLLATWMGSGMVTGTANFIYTYGPIAGLVHLIGEPLGLLLVALFLAKRAREKTSYTIPQLIERKFGSVARVILALCIILSYVGIVSYQFEAGGYILNITTGMSVKVGTLISAAIIIFLSVVGGLVSVAYTDAIGTLIIFTAMIIGLPIAIKQAGGLSGMISAIPAEQLSVTGKLSGIQLLGYTLPTIFLVLGEQNLYQRFGSAKNAEESRKSGIGLFWLGLLLDILILGLVTPAIILYPNLKNPDTAFFQVAMGLPKIVGAFMLASTVALFITTADSYLLSAGTNVTYDFWLKFINKDASDKQKLTVTRVSIVVLGLLALIIGKFFPSILSMQMYAYSIYGAAVTPAFLACLFWDKATKAGGLTSIIVGASTVLLWEIVLKNPMGLNSIIIAGPLSILCLVVVSLLTQKQ